MVCIRIFSPIIRRSTVLNVLRKLIVHDVICAKVDNRAFVDTSVKFSSESYNSL